VGRDFLVNFMGPLRKKKNYLLRICSLYAFDYGSEGPVATLIVEPLFSYLVPRALRQTG
jgi:hypothetical protein